MKIRIHGDAIRLRLNRVEVAAFALTGRVESVTHFPDTSLCCVLESEPGLAAPQADYDAGMIRIRVPAHHAAEWAASDAIALENVQPLPNGTQLEILIEKDLQCLHKGEEEKDPDAYPNPDALPGGAEQTS